MIHEPHGNRNLRVQSKIYLSKKLENLINANPKERKTGRRHTLQPKSKAMTDLINLDAIEERLNSESSEELYNQHQDEVKTAGSPDSKQHLIPSDLICPGEEEDNGREA